MARKDEAAFLLKEGNSPREIANDMGISLKSVVQYLYTKVGEGNIRRSDILYNIEPEIRIAIENAIYQSDENEPLFLGAYPLARQKISNLDWFEFDFIVNLLDAKVSRGDMYEFISDIELILHQAIKKVLISEFGPDESEWWRKGIPTKIRAECASLLEQDIEPAEHSYCYTNFIHLKDILNKQWSIFIKVLPKKHLKDKNDFLNNLLRLNHIRNLVMHPIKGIELTENDFRFVREFHESLLIDNWQNQDVVS
jgi:hypothetical protein